MIESAAIVMQTLSAAAMLAPMPMKVDDSRQQSPTPVVVASATTRAASPIPSNPPVDPQKAMAPTPQESDPIKKAFSFPFKVGMEVYQGVSNVPGYNRYSDGFWAGNSLASPSLGYVRWEDNKGNSARVALGVGGMYTGAGTSLNQPVEAYWQKSFKNTSVMVGKYWVPFGDQNWEFETKPGVMLQWSGGPHSLALSMNYNTTTRGLNTYLRGVRTFGENASLGLSLGAGKGLTYNTLHDVMWGLDGMVAWKGWRLSGEWAAALRGRERFGFGTAKLAYEKLGAWSPFVALYSWNDQSGWLGSFHSQALGVQYQLTPSTAIEAAMAPGSSRRTYWLQMRTAWER